MMYSDAAAVAAGPRETENDTMAATEALKALAVLNADLAAAIQKAANAGLDQADIAAAVQKAAELCESCDEA